ncbi:hypothetical protein DY000_02017458 [Brassica cretica]|uniref:Uncharacterized protein n=1 Tax=Brassica cretica TaxID=69181 RepID=A0ABQ7D9T5_BRACR|nr:hypothetical protein DY000_02017458 [Brassica cretica]
MLWVWFAGVVPVHRAVDSGKKKLLQFFFAGFYFRVAFASLSPGPFPAVKEDELDAVLNLFSGSFDGSRGDLEIVSMQLSVEESR